jgi:L-arabinose isomerase
VLSTAVDADMLDTFATMTSTELTLIDESTTRRGLASELRANDLYYSLAGRR